MNSRILSSCSFPTYCHWLDRCCLLLESVVAADLDRVAAAAVAAAAVVDIVGVAFADDTNLVAADRFADTAVVAAELAVVVVVVVAVVVVVVVPVPPGGAATAGIALCIGEVVESNLGGSVVPPPVPAAGVANDRLQEKELPDLR